MSENDEQYVGSLRRIVASLPTGQTLNAADDLLAWSAPTTFVEFITLKQNRFSRRESKKLKFGKLQGNALVAFVAHDWIERDVCSVFPMGLLFRDSMPKRAVCIRSSCNGGDFSGDRLLKFCNDRRSFITVVVAVYRRVVYSCGEVFTLECT